ncbi:hypothetical protein ACFL22_00825 [Patescibacteria group bacterium]
MSKFSRSEKKSLATFLLQPFQQAEIIETKIPPNGGQYETQLGCEPSQNKFMIFLVTDFCSDCTYEKRDIALATLSFE